MGVGTSGLETAKTKALKVVLNTGFDRSKKEVV